MSILIEVHWQQYRVRAMPGGLHQTHGRVDAEFARRVGSGSHHTATRIILQPCKIRRGTVRLSDGPSAAADYDRQALKLRVAQQLHRRIKGVHIKMCNSTDANFRLFVHAKKARTDRGLASRPPRET